MSSTASLASWVFICATYLRWRPAVREQQLDNGFDTKTRPKFQPWLAWYGLCCSIVLCMKNFRWSWLTVLLSGYKVFIRGASFWGHYIFSWGYTLAPYAVFTGLIVLLAFPLVKNWVKNGVWDWGVPSLFGIDLHNGASEQYVEPVRHAWERWCDDLLDRL